MVYSEHYPPSRPSLVPLPLPKVRPILRRTFKRCLRLLPSVLLLLFVVSLIFVTLMQIAVIHAHRRSVITQKIPNSSSFGSSAVIADLKPKLGPISGLNNDPTSHQNVLRIEALLDRRKSPSLEANKKMVQNFANSVRIKDIIDFAEKEKKKILSPSEQMDGSATSLDSSMNSELVLLGNKSSPAFSSSSSGLPLRRGKYFCPLVPPNLRGRIHVQLHPTLEDLEGNMKNTLSRVLFGGHWEPQDCYPQHRVAIIIPYRDRKEHLMVLLYHLHPILQRQQLDYKVYVVEQFGNDTFNKGVLMNAGVKEALKENDFHCFVFHDVDMIPEDDRNLYSCPSIPRHMSPAVDKFNYTLPYKYLVGGVFAISKEHFILVNGYSNLYWGWGGEDDDMSHRLALHNLHITRPPESIARYRMIKHNPRETSPSNVRYALLRMAKRRATRDGLSSVRYKVIYRQAERLYTHIIVEIGQIHKWHFPSKNKLVLHF